MNMMSAATDSGTELQYFIYIHSYLISSRQFLYRSVFQHTVMIRRTKEIWLMVDTKKKDATTFTEYMKYITNELKVLDNPKPQCS